METRKFEIVTTRKGYPAIWEKGGGLSNRGHAQIICGIKGEMLRAISLGHRACENHALFILKAGMHIIETFHHRGEVEISIYRIDSIVGNTKIGQDEALEETFESAIGTLVNRFENNEWDEEPTAQFEEAIKAAVSKCRTYHCRGACYALEPERRY